ncbi:MAG: ATP--guanido phosphotransferase [Elusimicrobiota bacterium]
MELRNLALKNIGWLGKKSEENPGIVSTRIRLARNLSDIPFPQRSVVMQGASDNQLKESLDKIFEACEKSSFFKNSRKIRLAECSDIDRKLLVERHIISHEHAGTSKYGGVVIDEREQLSIMVNEEDHLRIQYIEGGLNFFQAWDIMNKIDDDLSNYLDIAYSDKWGYLTSCPTNTGTGMRASCQLHLPGLGMSNGIKMTMENINKMGMVVRGLYGEGTRVMGNMVQVSNQVTLGISEKRITDSLNRLVGQVAQRENKVRDSIVKRRMDELKDMAFRSYGILTSAYKIGIEEALNLLSNIRFGVYVGILDVEMEILNNLIIKIQPAHLQEIENKTLNSRQKDIVRAEKIKEEIGK